MQRFYVALVAYAVIALAAWFTLSDLRIRSVTVIVLAGFALRTWAHGQRERREAEESASRESSIGPM